MSFHFKTVYQHQQQDPALLVLLHQELMKYVVQVLGNYQIICARTKTGIYMCLTDAMLPKVIKYFHEVTAHNEGTKLIGANYMMMVLSSSHYSLC